MVGVCRGDKSRSIETLVHQRRDNERHLVKGVKFFILIDQQSRWWNNLCISCTSFLGAESQKSQGDHFLKEYWDIMPYVTFRKVLTVLFIVKVFETFINEIVLSLFRLTVRCKLYFKGIIIGTFKMYQLQLVFT